MYRRYTDPEAGEAVYGASVGYLHGENHYREPIWSPNGEIVQYLEAEECKGEGDYYDVRFHKRALDKGEEPIRCDVRVFGYEDMPAPTVEWFADSNRLLIASRPVVIYNCAEDSCIWISQDNPTPQESPYQSDKDARSMEASLSPDEKYIAYELIDDVDLHEIARTTAGFVGADLENLMNEAAIQAARDDRAYIMKEDIDKSFIKVGIGTEKKSRVVPESERRITAYHESGHAILFHLLPDVGPVYTVSIIPTGTGAAGYTMPLPENDNVFMTRGKMIQDIMVSLGGRIAEELILDDITTGASQDIKQVTQYARAMVTKFGMSDELGLINYDSGEGDEVFLGKEIGQQRPYGENTQTVIDQEVKKIVNKCYKDAKAMIEEHMDVLHKCAALLLEKERINRAEFEALFDAPEEVSEEA